MNKVILMGRLTRDPEVRYSQGANQTAVARFSVAVDRRFKKDGEQNADFINCVTFGKTAEFIEKYFKKGMRVGLTGRIQTGSYEDKDGKKVYTTDVVAENVEFVESKNSSDSEQHDSRPTPINASADGFTGFDNEDDEELPFN